MIANRSRSVSGRFALASGMEEGVHNMAVHILLWFREELPADDFSTVPVR